MEDDDDEFSDNSDWFEAHLEASALSDLMSGKLELLKERLMEMQSGEKSAFWIEDKDLRLISWPLLA